MSDFRPVSDTIMVSPQIGTACIDAAAEAGFTLIINNRPDFEEEGQPTNEELAAYAETKGLKWAFIPVAGGLTMEAIESTGYAFRDNAKVLAFCRTGTRSCNLWGLAEAFLGRTSPEDIVGSAARAGYDLSSMIPTLEHLHTNAG